ncbi:MAG: hypothetical protein ACQEXJ_20410 [Myxococcota bacterium]
MRLAIQAPDLEWLRQASPQLAGRDLASMSFVRTPVELEPEGWKRTLDILAERSIGAELDRVYFGTEFCRYRYADGRAFAEAGHILRDLGLRGSLVLGSLPEDLFDDAMAGVDAFVRTVPDAEVVANDWGTAAHLSGRGVEVELGRMLFEVKRLPRFSGEPPTPKVDGSSSQSAVLEEQIAELSQDPWDHEAGRALLEQLRPTRYQIDLVPQGLQPRRTVALPRTLHAPWTYVTGGAQCPLLDLQPDQDGVERCSQRCLTTEIHPIFARRTWPIVEIGHTVFLLAVAVLPKFLELEGIDRLLLHPQIPA